MIPTKTMTVSDFNLVKLTTKELSEHIAASIAIGSNIAIFGRRGIGKTHIAKQEIKKANLKEVYVNLSTFERPDMGGFPLVFSAQPRKYIEFLLPQFYEALIEGDQDVVVLFDELDKCDPGVLAPLLEFVQFHSINQKALPKLRSVIMTGNLISEGGSRPSPPLLDRCEKFLVEADVASWLAWSAQSGKIHPSIIAYVKNNPKDLFGAVDPEDRYADPSPRGWESASQILYKGEANGWSQELLKQKVSGCVGKEIGIKYAVYFEHYQQLLPMIDELYEGKDISERCKNLPPSKQLVICMIACSRFAFQLDAATPKTPPASHKLVAHFLSKVAKENAIAAIVSTITVWRMEKCDLMVNPAWEPWMREIQKQMKGLE